MTPLRPCGSIGWSHRLWIELAPTIVSATMRILFYSSRCARRLSAASAFVLVFACGVRAATVTLRPVADTSLHEQVPENNLGRSSTILVGTTAQGNRTRALIRFDVSAALPPHANIHSARLQLFLTADASGGSGSLGIQVHRMGSAWSEGTKSGNAGEPAAPGESTWKWRASPDIAWGIPGALVGGDFAAAASANGVVGGLGTWSWEAGLADDVRLWLTNAAPNEGWILIAEPEGVARTARRFASREDPDRAPLLVIDYDIPVEKIRLPMPRWSQGQLVLTLPLVAGRSHVLEYKDAIGSGNWAPWAVLPSEPSEWNREFPVAVEGSGRFYRLLRF